MIRITSFGFRAGGAPAPAFVFDCRGLKNPHFEPALRDLDGTSPAVKTFVEKSQGFNDLYAQAKFHAITYAEPHVAFGCFGGRHRSVASAELLAEDLRLHGHQVEVTHRELAKA